MAFAVVPLAGNCGAAFSDRGSRSVRAPAAVACFEEAKFNSVGRPSAALRVGSNVRLRGEVVGLFHPLKSNFGYRSGSSNRKRSPRIVTVVSSVEEGVKDSGSSETSTEGSDSLKVDSPPASTSTVKRPFKTGGKISSIAAKQSSVDSKATGSVEGIGSARKSALSIGAKQPGPVGQLSPKAAEQLKVSKPASVFTQSAGVAKPASPFTQAGTAKPASPFTTGAAQNPPSPFTQPVAKPASPFVQPSRGKRVVDAFREGEKEGKTTKFGQPIVPSNIFQDVRRTPEEQAADAFKFSVNPGQLVLVGSFLVIIAVMVGTAYVVWKLGGIHYNEY